MVNYTEMARVYLPYKRRFLIDDVLGWTTGKKSTREELVDSTWGLLYVQICTDGFPELYFHMDKLGGDVYLTKIETDGRAFLVTIYEGGMG